MRVRDAGAQSAFYGDVLGMRDFGSGLLGYASDCCCLKFSEARVGPHQPDLQNLYWKIGITLRDLDRAVAYLRERAWPVSAPRQFRDIGYLCHLHDPEGLPIELLQQGFQGDAQPAGVGHQIGGQAILAHLTLRSVDLAAMRQLCETQLGMRLLSRQPVRDRGFTLYFYAWSAEALPNPDLEAVENRPWLWARPYGLLEVQHLEQADRLSLPAGARAGFDGFAFAGEAGLKQVTLADLSPLAGATFA